MSRWIDSIAEECQFTASSVAERKQISQSAVEKDWWVTAIRFSNLPPRATARAFQKYRSVENDISKKKSYICAWKR